VIVRQSRSLANVMTAGILLLAQRPDLACSLNDPGIFKYRMK